MYVMVEWQQNEARASYGLEIEQFESDVPGSVHGRGYGSSNGPWGSWHSDASGPIETELGPYKRAKSLARKVIRDARDASGRSIPWQWKAASDSGQATADGAGSHVHYEFNDPVGCTDDELVRAWTIAYNSIIELTPILSPFFCHDWRHGFRSGTNYPGGGSNIEKWASPQTTRLSRGSIRQRVNSGRASRSYKAVTWNGSRPGGKPLTLELRCNDAHPAIAMVGLSMMKKLVVQAIRRGWSVKSDNLPQNWDAAYSAANGNAPNQFDGMAHSGGINFQENRGIPRLEGQSFDSARDALIAIIDSFNPSPDGWRDRVAEWVREGAVARAGSFGPQNRNDSVWSVMDDNWSQPW